MCVLVAFVQLHAWTWSFRCDDGKRTQMIERTEKMERADRQQVRQVDLLDHIALASKPYTKFAEVNLFKHV